MSSLPNPTPGVRRRRFAASAGLPSCVRLDRGSAANACYRAPGDSVPLAVEELPHPHADGVYLRPTKRSSPTRSARLRCNLVRCCFVAKQDNKDGAVIEPRGRNRWQSVANGAGAETAKSSQNRCRGLRPVAEGSAGKDGVDGSSPSEGSAIAKRNFFGQARNVLPRAARDSGALCRGLVSGTAPDHPATVAMLRLGNAATTSPCVSTSRSSPSARRGPRYGHRCADVPVPPGGLREKP